MHQDGGQLGERTGILGTQPRHLLVAGHRLIVLAKASEHVAQAEPRLVQFGPELDGPAIAFDGLIILAQHGQSVSQVARRHRVVGLKCEGAAEAERGPIGIALPDPDDALVVVRF